MFRFKPDPMQQQMMQLQSFNTSYVSVQDGELHHYAVVQEFQYILCFGSRW